MRKISAFLLLFSCLFFLSPQLARATHALGADLIYQYVGPNQYEVTVKFYRDCRGIPTATPVNNITVRYNSSCGAGSAVIDTVAGTGSEISTGLYPPCGITSCNGGNGYGVQEWVYQGIITLPDTCPDWVFSIAINARNAAITTIYNPGLTTLYIEAQLDNLNQRIDSSPVFSTPPVARFCVSHSFSYNQGATDPDGDSLVYSLVDALQGTGNIVDYILPFSGVNPIASSPPVSIDPQTGVITLNPTAIEVGVIAILVEEYRDGILIGSVRRDMQVNIEATCNFTPLLDSTTTFSNITAQCLDSNLYIHLDVPVLCSSISPDGTDFRIIDPMYNIVPTDSGKGVNCTGSPFLTDVILLKLHDPLSLNGVYKVISKVGFDGNTLYNACGIPMPEFDTVSFYFNNCYSGAVDLTNVSVDDENRKMEISWIPPADTIWAAQFQSFNIYRSENPDGNYNTPVATLLSSAARTFTDATVDVPVQPYNYAVRIQLNWGYSGVLSDTIQSIYLQDGIFNADSLTISLSWTPYWGWTNPLYRLMESNDGGISFTAVDGAVTSGTTFNYTRPLAKGKYLVRIETTNGNLLSRSNWFEFDIIKLDVVPPNVITPNGDGINDSFSIENMELYPNSRLTIYNRWGKKIYETGHYRNDWKGENVPEGIYYYTLKIADSKSSEMAGMVCIIRNK